MLFLHGFTGAPESGRCLREALMGDSRNLSEKGEPGSWDAPLLTGHGPTPEFSSFEDEIERIASHPAQIAIAYSMGARLALTAAALRPGSFRELILVGVNPGLENETARAERIRADEERARQLESSGLEAFLHHWESLPLFAEARLDETTRAERRAHRRLHQANGLAHALRATGLGAMPNLWPYLPTMETRIRFLYGEHDTKFAAIAQRAAALSPYGSALAVEGAHHDAILFNPLAVARAVSGP